MLPPDAWVAAHPDDVLDGLDGLMLAGGADIDPRSYGIRRHPKTVNTRPDRDRAEIALALRALERDLPVLGICRGMQLLNVALGGTLIQHLPDDVGHTDHRRALGSFDNADHDVRLAPGSLAARACGETRHATKSHHHQAVDALGDGRRRFAAGACLDDLSRRSRCRTPVGAGRAVAPGGRPAVARRAVVRGEAALVPAAALAPLNCAVRRWRPRRGGCARQRRRSHGSHARAASGTRHGPTRSVPLAGSRRERQHRAVGRTKPVRSRSYMWAAPVPRPTAIRAAACTVLAAGLAAPLLRRRLRLKPPVVIAAAASTPLALTVIVPRSRARDVAHVRAADVRLRRDVQDAQRRPREARGARPGRLPGQGRPVHRRAARRPRSGSNAPSARPGDFARLGEAARVVALGVVRVPARHRRLRARCATATSSRRPRRRSTRRSTSA